ncbi:MAG TPA: PP2C family protein-serine/threonine phosphatase [Hyphomicrobiales bacterium]|nr:PP2C family protein-serine/threonine phosphatase [Hyphomicrobiales bacterium]
MSFFERFCATLESAPVQAVFYGELAPHALEAQRWTWLRSKRPGEPVAVGQEQVFALREGELSDEASTVLNALAEQHGLGQADTLCGWFSGLADAEAERGVLVLFKRGDSVTEHLQSWVCAQTILAIRNDLLLQSERHRYRDWLDEVRTIKEKLLPSAEHRLPGLDHAVYYQSSVGGGGDYYELIDLRPARVTGESSSVVGVALCDVSGHGPGAAVEVAMIDAIVRTYRGRPQDGPAKVLAYINTHFFTRQLRGSFVTGVVCHVDFEQHSLNWVNAGHLPIVLARREGDIEVLDQSDGIPVGIHRGTTWQVHRTPLAPGDGVLLMSDGITEALSASGEQFGLERVLACLRRRPEGDAGTVVAALVQALRAHTAGHEEQDDQTLLYLIYAPDGIYSALP